MSYILYIWSWLEHRRHLQQYKHYTRWAQRYDTREEQETIANNSLKRRACGQVDVGAYELITGGCSNTSKTTYEQSFYYSSSVCSHSVTLEVYVCNPSLSFIISIIVALIEFTFIIIAIRLMTTWLAPSLGVWVRRWVNWQIKTQW